MWPSDLVLRAATAPAMTSTAGWAAELVQTLVADGLRALGPASAGALLLQQGLVLSFEGHGAISAPGLVAEYGNAGFVAEGEPIPVRQLADHCSAAPAAQARGDRRAHPRDGRVFQRRGADRRCADARRRPHARRGAVRRQSGKRRSPRRLAQRRRRSDARAPTPTRFGALFEDAATLINSLAPVAGNGPLCAGRFARSRCGDAARALHQRGQQRQGLRLERGDQRSARDRARRAGGGAGARAGRSKPRRRRRCTWTRARQPVGTVGRLARCFRPTASRSRCAGRSLGRCAIREASHG